MAQPRRQSTAPQKSARCRRLVATVGGRDCRRRQAPLWRPAVTVAAFLVSLAAERNALHAAESPPRPAGDVAPDAGIPSIFPDAEAPAALNTAAIAVEPESSEATNPLDPFAGETWRDMSELDLETLMQTTIVTATKSEVKEDEAPAIATVISRDEILRWGYRSVQEALTHVAGIYMIDDQSIPNIGVRGVSGGLRSESGLVKVMIDGHSVAFRSTGGNWLGPELIPLSAVQQIEVIRGPASALYGADAFLGVINVVTRHPEKMNGGEIGVNGNYAGSALASGQDASLGTEIGKFKLLAAYRIHTEDHSGLQLSPLSPAPKLASTASPDLRARDLTQGSNVVFLKASGQVTPTARISLLGSYSQLDRGAEFADWAQLTHGLDANGHASGTNISLRQGMIDARAELALSPNLDLTVDGLLFAGGPTSRDRIEVGSEIYYVKRDFGYRGMDLGAEVSWRPHRTVAVLFGAGYILDSEQLTVANDILKTTIPPIPAGGISTSRSGALDHVNFTNPAAHAQVIWSPEKSRLSVTAGARYDHHNIYGDRLSARLAGVLNLSKRLHVKLLYGNAFKAPAPQLLYGFPLTSGDIMGNPQLKPSTVHTVEAQISYRYGKYFFLSTGLAGNYLLDQAEFTQQGDNQVAHNLARTLSLSWETVLQINYQKLVAAYVNTAFNHTIRHTDDRGYVAALTNYGNLAYPAFIANAGISARLAQIPLRLGVEGSLVSARRASSSDILEHGGLYEYRPYVVVGGNLQTVGLRLLPNRATVIRLIVRNLFGTQIFDPGFAGVDYPQLGRTVGLDLIQEW